MLFTILPVIFLLGTSAGGISATSTTVHNATTTNTTSSSEPPITSAGLNSPSSHTTTLTSLPLSSTRLRGDTTILSSTRRTFQTHLTSVRPTTGNSSANTTNPSTSPTQTAKTGHTSITSGNSTTIVTLGQSRTTIPLTTKNDHTGLTTDSKSTPATHTSSTGHGATLTTKVATDSTAANSPSYSTPSVTKTTAGNATQGTAETQTTKDANHTTLSTAKATQSLPATSNTANSTTVVTKPENTTTLSTPSTNTGAGTKLTTAIAPSTPSGSHSTTHSTESTSKVMTSTVITTTPSEPSKTTVTTATETTPKTTMSTALTTQPLTGGTTTVATGTTAAPTVTTAAPVIVCPAKPCPAESVCLDGACACVAGSFLNNGQCVKAQVFPGQLRVTSLNYSTEMSDRSSALFQKTAADISAQLSQILSGQKGYLRSDVIKLTQGSVVATVDNIYEGTNLTDQDSKQAIDHAIASSTSGLLVGAVYTGGHLCERGPLSPCDVSSTSCSAVNGQATCTCLEGYVTIGQLYSNSSCKACPSGQRAVENACQPCSFGYAGFNCNDASLLAVVVVSCVLGGTLLILILALIAYCCWKGFSNSEANFDSPYSVTNMTQPWPTDITPIPRATPSWDLGPSMEMTEGAGTHALVDKKNQTNGLLNAKGWKKTGSYDLQPDDLKTFKGKNTSRYSYLVQGHENPYFLPGDENKN